MAIGLIGCGKQESATRDFPARRDSAGVEIIEYGPDAAARVSHWRLQKTASRKFGRADESVYELGLIESAAPAIRFNGGIAPRLENFNPLDVRVDGALGFSADDDALAGLEIHRFETDSGVLAWPISKPGSSSPAGQSSRH